MIFTREEKRQTAQCCGCQSAEVGELERCEASGNCKYWQMIAFGPCGALSTNLVEKTQVRLVVCWCLMTIKRNHECGTQRPLRSRVCCWQTPVQSLFLLEKILSSVEKVSGTCCVMQLHRMVQLKSFHLLRTLLPVPLGRVTCEVGGRWRENQINKQKTFPFVRGQPRSFDMIGTSE